MVMGSVMIFSDVMTTSSFGLCVSWGCFICQLSIWRFEFLSSVTTHEQQKFSQCYLLY